MLRVRTRALASPCHGIQCVRLWDRAREDFEVLHRASLASLVFRPDNRLPPSQHVFPHPWQCGRSLCRIQRPSAVLSRMLRSKTHRSRQRNSSAVRRIWKSRSRQLRCRAHSSQLLVLQLLTERAVRARLSARVRQRPVLLGEQSSQDVRIRRTIDTPRASVDFGVSHMYDKNETTEGARVFWWRFDKKSCDTHLHQRA
jgi:hypothetical protein